MADKDSGSLRVRRLTRTTGLGLARPADVGSRQPGLCLPLLAARPRPLILPRRLSPPESRTAVPRPIAAYPGPDRNLRARPTHLRLMLWSSLFLISSSTFRSCWARAKGTRRLFLGAICVAVAHLFPEDRDCKKDRHCALEARQVHSDLSAALRPDISSRFRQSRFVVHLCYVRKNDTPDGSIVSRFTGPGRARFHR